MLEPPSVRVAYRISWQVHEPYIAFLHVAVFTVIVAELHTELTKQNQDYLQDASFGFDTFLPFNVHFASKAVLNLILHNARHQSMQLELGLGDEATYVQRSCGNSDD